MKLLSTVHRLRRQFGKYLGVSLSCIIQHGTNDVSKKFRQLNKAIKADHFVTPYPPVNLVREKSQRIRFLIDVPCRGGQCTMIAIQFGDNATVLEFILSGVICLDSSNFFIRLDVETETYWYLCITLAPLLMKYEITVWFVLLFYSEFKGKINHRVVNNLQTTAVRLLSY